MKSTAHGILLCHLILPLLSVPHVFLEKGEKKQTWYFCERPGILDKAALFVKGLSVGHYLCKAIL